MTQHTPLRASLGSRGSWELLPVLVSSTFISTRAAANGQPCPCSLGVLLAWDGTENLPGEPHVLHNATSMSWTNGTGAASHPSKVGCGEGMCLGFGEDIDPGSHGDGAAFRLLTQSQVLTLRWSSWA